MKGSAAVAVVVVALLAGCRANAPEPPVVTEAPVAADGRVITETVAAPSLANNLLGDPAEREIMVYLPPSYEVTDERYPVVYYLAGYSQHIGTFRSFAEILWEQMLAEDAREFIIVEVDGISALGGNFYTNSPVTGNAEDFVTEDLIDYVDSTYRTIPEASARALSGFSMGGGATINIGLRHPDVYAALYAHSPGVFHEDGGLEGFLASNGNWRAYGAAFAWDADAEEPYFRSIDPRAPLEQQDPELVAAWESGFGDQRVKVADYLAQPERLIEIKVAYGTRDENPWIPEGSAWFVDLLEENDIPVSEHVFDGTHAPDYVYFFQGDCVDFFTRVFDAAGA